LIPPPKNEIIWEAQKHGFTRTAIRYHIKYCQFWLIILFAIKVKSSEDSLSIINKSAIMKESLDTILNSLANRIDRAHDMRHALLYMAFPDEFERIISTRDKQKIIEKYENIFSEKTPSDLDEKILMIRKKLSSKYDKPDRQFDFYIDLKKEWRPDNTVSPNTVTIDTDNGTVALPSDEDELDSSKGESKGTSEHTEIQWLLLKTGNEMGLDVWVAKNDRNRKFEDKSFSDLPRMKSKLPLNFDEVTNRTIELIDMLWLKEGTILAAFEIESTTSIYSGILSMADLISRLPNINIPLYIVAPDGRRKKVFEEVNRPVFARLSPKMCDVCKFISFVTLKNKLSQISSVIKHISPAFIDDISEFCEIDIEQ
jgi:hypothetical protein